jgi:membrane-bound lytic murein transglycosylase B
LITRILWASCLALHLSATAAAGLDQTEIDGFVAEMSREHAFEPAALRGLLGQANRLDSLLAAISKPAEYKPWHVYRPIFITDQRIQGGTRFWASHADALAAASLQSGVPAEIIVSIIGVETAYGHHAGSYKVLDSLGTLAFHYPPRAPFFRGELRNFLLLAREEGVDPTTLKGSYAGAMGIPQFMPSSFRAYAVDFDGDGKRDIWASPRDAIGSVANYLKVHGWEAGKPIAYRALESAGNAGAVSQTVELKQTLAELAALGVKPDGTATPESPAVLLTYEQPQNNEYWLGFQNFYVITRYNRSPKYALAVFQLAEEIRRVREGGAR